MQTVLLNPSEHDRVGFDCAVEPLNRYLQQFAGQQASKDHARTYVLELPGSKQIAGFYSLTMIHLELTDIPPPLQKKHKTAQTAGLIARLAVDTRYQNKGYGGFLLYDALVRLYQASMLVGFPLVFVDAKDGKAGFYQHYGFNVISGNRMYLPISTIGQLIKHNGVEI